MRSPVIKSIAEVERQASQHDAVLVAYSGGKDSKVVLELCAKAFRRVEVFCMSLVPGMRITQEALAGARERYGVVTHDVQHWSIYQDLRTGLFGAVVPNDVKAGFKTTYAEMTNRTGIELIATGCRKAESLGRAAVIKMGVLPGWHLIADWSRKNVLDFLACHQIPLPANDGRADMSGVSLHPQSLLWMHQHYPDDFERIEVAFPFVRGVVMREKFYGRKHEAPVR